jgi:hypothetical protein
MGHAWVATYFSLPSGGLVMRPVYKVFLTVGALALLVRSAPAQQPPGVPGAMSFMLFANKDVQKELKLSDEQVAKCNKAMQEVMQKQNKEEIMKLFFPFPVTASDEQLKSYLKTTQQLTDDTATALEDTLKPEQVKRFKQLALQQTINAVGVGVFMQSDVDKALKLTDKQKEDLKPMIEDLRKKQQDAIKSDPAALFKKRAAVNKESVDAEVKMLTDDQKKTWKDLVGEPFEFKVQLPGAPPEKKEPGKDDSAPTPKQPEKGKDKP